MVWIYDDPPFTKREEHAYRSLRRKLKDKKFVDKLIKLISLYSHLKRIKPTTVKQVETSAYFDKKQTKPIFDEKTAKKVLTSLKQKGGDTNYPYIDTVANGVLRDYTPSIIGEPVGAVYGAITGTVDTLKNNIPFADLALETVHSASSVGVTSVGDIGELVGGPVGAAVVAPFTAIAAGLTAGLATIEGDLGGAIVHIANWVPGIGSALGKMIEKGEHMAKTLKDHKTVSSYFPYMSEYHRSLETLPDSPSTELVTPAAAGKRLSTMKHRSNKWMKTQRKRSATR
jgi:hypothetical protein